MRSHAESDALLCPACRVPLAMSERQSVEIDYCPQCRGVWLNRGELDKIIDRSAMAQSPERTVHAPPRQGGGRSGNDHGYDRRLYRKPKTWLSELFD